jgi:hypothetical protein
LNFHWDTTLSRAEEMEAKLDQIRAQLNDKDNAAENAGTENDQR